MKLLVTGGAGFIGSTVVDMAIAQGHDVRVYDNLETGVRTNVNAAATFIHGDIRDGEALHEAMAGVDTVIHLAAMVSVERSVRDPQTCWDVNVAGTHNVLTVAQAVGCRRIVLASSAAVYGNSEISPKQEGLTPEPASPYAYSKWMNEVHAEYFSRYLELETVCLRFFNVYGPRQRPDSPYAGVISIAAAQLLAGKPFTVHGTGEQTRDFVFVDDVAGAVLAGATRPGLKHEVVNVGNGESISLLELLKTMGVALHAEPNLKFGPARAGDVLHSRAETGRLHNALGYAPKVGLQEGLTRTMNWLKGPTGVKP
jgi:UDP-glucose 4-epimerase